MSIYLQIKKLGGNINIKREETPQMSIQKTKKGIKKQKKKRKNKEK